MSRPVVIAIGLAGGVFMQAYAAERVIPRPLSNHPGNLFVQGESIRVPAPTNSAGEWGLVDEAGTRVADAQAVDGRFDLGVLPVGYYELRPMPDDALTRIALGVLAPLRAPTPKTSPIGLDVAMAWFYPSNDMPFAANVSALAGVNWVRDRLNWGQIEPARNQFAEKTTYDASARVQAAAGLRVLQVNHITPAWAGANPKRFPDDLRDIARFYTAAARRWQGQVLAFEPWNEADIEMFGGHTGAQIASLQKAAYFGLKAGNPNVIVGQSVFALPRADTLTDFHANAAWPYFDTFNLHHYCGFDDYPDLYAKHRAVSAGKPMWVSECALPVSWTGDAERKEMTDDVAREQAMRVAKTYACSLHEGTAVTIFFMLPHYSEHQIQYGVMRADHTPGWLAYVALAAVGRILADARPLGRLRSDNPAVRAFLFQTALDGQAHEVILAWTTEGEATVELPVTPSRVFDYLGREAVPGALSPAPTFFVFPPGASQAMHVDPVPSMPPRQEGQPCPVVLQAIQPVERINLEASASRIATGATERVALFVYNFGSRPARGTLRVTAPPGWRVECPQAVEIAPEDRVPLTMEVTGTGAVATVRIDGDFGDVGKAVLSLRFEPDSKRMP